MSENIIKRKDLEILRWIEVFLTEYFMTEKQKNILENGLKIRHQAAWDGTYKSVSAANMRIHDTLDVIRGLITKYHVSCLAKHELKELAGILMIDLPKTGKSKKDIWFLIKRRISSDISRDELGRVFLGLASGLSEKEIRWLRRNSKATWKDCKLQNGDWNKSWLAKNRATITDLEILIEDIIGMTVKVKVENYHVRLTRTDLFAIEERLEVVPPSSQIIPKGVMKMRILLKIRNEVPGLLNEKGSVAQMRLTV